MNPFKIGYNITISTLAIFLLALTGCDDRKMPSGEAVTSEEEVVPTQAKPVSLKEKESSDTPPKVTKPKEKKEREEAVLHVIEKGDTVLIKGSIKSHFERKDIIALLQRALSGKELVDELKSDYNRIALGWEGRVTEDLLIPFINVVENGELHYEKGIVRLEGTVNKEMESQIIQKKVINTIYGPYSRDIENNLKIKKK